VAMRYWHPLTEETLREIESQGFGRLVLLPLYPQYSKTTTGSSLNEWNRHYRPRPGVVASTVASFYDHPLYLEAVVEKINEGLAASQFEDSKLVSAARSFAGAGLDLPDSTFEAQQSGSGHPQSAMTRGSPADAVLVFSAHGVPISVIEAGDPYRRHVEETVRLVMERGGWPNRHLLCYQSRVGPGRWLEPTLDRVLQQLAAESERRALAIPISFVTDHVETLSEIDIEARALAGRLGIQQFAMMPALNDSPKFIEALASLVFKALASG